MDRKTLVKNLERNKRWVLKHLMSARTETGRYTAENIVVACVQIMKQCGRPISSYWSWAHGDRPWREMLKGIQRTYTRCEANQALRELIEVTISEVEACRWVEDFWVGALPLNQEPRRLTAAEKRARSERGRAMQRARVERHRAKLERRFSGQGQ